MMLVEIYLYELKTAFESFTCGFILADISDVVAICVLLLYAFECVNCVLVDVVDEEGASSYIAITPCSEPLECST